MKIIYNYPNYMLSPRIIIVYIYIYTDLGTNMSQETTAIVTYQTGHMIFLLTHSALKFWQMEVCSVYYRETDHTFLNPFKLIVYVILP